MIRLPPNRTFALVYALSRVARTARMGRTGIGRKGFSAPFREQENSSYWLRTASSNTSGSIFTWQLPFSARFLLTFW